MVINRFLLESKEENTEFSAEELESIRERDEQRLRLMNGYCNTTGCLRNYILHYFGERVVGDCGYCGNCQKEFVEKDATEAAKSIVQCIREQGQRYGMNVVVGTLLGRKNAKLREYAVERYAAFGVLSKLREPEIKQIIGQMIEEGLLQQTKDKYALLKFTNATKELISGERNLIIRAEKESAETQKAGGDAGRSTNRKSDILNSKGLDFFEVLRSLRTEIAREESLPPYLVFSDRTLIDMCVKLPMNREEMFSVTGVGEHKYEKYGERFLACIREYTGGKKEKFYFGEQGDAVVSSGSNGKRERERKQKKEFFITEEMRDKILYLENCYLGEFVEQLNGLRDESTTKRLTASKILEWLTTEGYVEVRRIDGRFLERPTKKGEAVGIRVGTRVSAKGNEYETLCYGEQVQRMIVEKYLVSVARV